ncbi:TadE/TadG family type IV pilus assembly protein [Aureliella helgolandensis]|uniref:TadE-like protein n=1 Tax=Aureliella helgolandensis TaxID=2527968 RepID=A0A518G1C2_9BACT|nr:TadE family protein [Aureliella helgolandensis]QDV22397.1 TadE-like protein [Aureliella helgolandensis]
MMNPQLQDKSQLLIPTAIPASGQSPFISRRRGRVQPKVRSDKQRRGVTTVEFALVSPIIFMIFLAAIELTRLNFLKHTAANAAYEGARTAIVPGGTPAEAQLEAQRILTQVGAGNGVTVNVVDNADRIVVTVNLPVDQNSWGVGRFTHGLTVSQSCALTKENL